MEFINVDRHRDSFPGCGQNMSGVVYNLNEAVYANNSIDIEIYKNCITGMTYLTGVSSM